MHVPTSHRISQLLRDADTLATVTTMRYFPGRDGILVLVPPGYSSQTAPSTIGEGLPGYADPHDTGGLASSSQVMESGEQMNIKVPRAIQGEVRSVAKCSFCNETLFVAQPMVVMHCPGREDKCDLTCRPAEACPAIDSALHVACAVWLDRSALKGGY